MHGDALRVSGDSDLISEIASLSVDLYTLLKEVLEIIDNDDVVFAGELAVDLELVANLLLLLGTLLEHSLLAHLFSIFNIK